MGLRVPARGPRGLFLTLLATNALTLVAATAAAPTLPVLAVVFGTTPEAAARIPLVLTLTPLAIGCSAPLAGIAIDRVGRRPVLLAGALGFAISGSAGALAGSLGWLLATRVGLGVAAACTMTATTTVITDTYDGAARAQVLALQAAIVGVVGTAVIVLSGALVVLDWRAPFLLYLMGLPVVLLVLRWIPAVPAPATPGIPGVPPVAARGAAPLQQRRQRPLRGPAGAVAPVVLATYTGMLALQITNFLVAIHVPFDLEARFGVTGTVAGVAVGLGTLAYAAGAIVSVPLSQRLAVPGVVTVAMAFLAVGHAGLTTTWVTVVVLSNLVLGLGFGFIVPNLIAWLSTVGPVAIRGRLFGGMTAALFLGQFLSPFVWAPVVGRVDRVGAFSLAAWVAGFAAVLALSRTRRPAAVAAR